jgi:uncharacterized protein (TIGR02246 family)
MPKSSSTPEQVIHMFASAMGDGRADDAVALYEADAVFLPAPDATPITGLEAIREALSGFAALRPTMSADIRKVVTAGDTATVLNAWHLRGTTPDGDPVEMSGTSADVLRRRPDGTWGILIDDPWGMPPRLGASN